MPPLYLPSQRSRAITLQPDRIFLWQLGVIALLMLGHWIGLQGYLQGLIAHERFVSQYLDLNGEGTPAAYFSALSLLATALVAWFLSANADQKADRRFWGLTALLLAFFSLDEAVSVHEGFVVIGERFLPREGIFFFAWWAPYLLALAPLLAVLVPGLLRLAPSTRWSLVIGGALFVTGALGMELAESEIAARAVTHPPGSPYYEMLYRQIDWLVLAEECLEMVGVAIVLRGLLIHAGRHAPPAAVAVAPATRRRVAQHAADAPLHGPS